MGNQEQPLFHEEGVKATPLGSEHRERLNTLAQRLLSLSGNIPLTSNVAFAHALRAMPLDPDVLGNFIPPSQRLEAPRWTVS